MSRDPSTFASSDPAVIEWWEQSLIARKEYRAKVDAFAAEYGMGREAVVLAGWSIGVAGLEVLSSDREDGPPEGWRIVDGVHASWIQPYRRSKAQKAIHEAMPSMAEPRESMPGYEHEIFPGGLPGFFVNDGTAYASTDAPERFDLDVWASIPLSEFYAAREANDATNATDAEGTP